MRKDYFAKRALSGILSIALCQKAFYDQRTITSPVVGQVSSDGYCHSKAGAPHNSYRRPSYSLSSKTHVDESAHGQHQYRDNADKYPPYRLILPVAETTNRYDP